MAVTSTPSPTNAYVPSHDATGNLTISYSRNPRDFALNRWATITPIKKNIGLYLRFNAQQAARVRDPDLGEFLWKDGAEAPTGNWALEAFTWAKYIADRYAFPFTMGRLTVQQATWDVVSQHSRISAQLAMTARTVKAVDKLRDTTLYASGHVLTQAAAKWDTGTTTNPVIKRALNLGGQLINKQTLGVVKPGDLAAVLSPALATAMASSAEIQDFLKGSPYALAQVRGDVPSQNGQWGLPDLLYNYQIVVEDAVRNSSLKGEDPQAIDYIFPGTECALVARPGALVSDENSPNFSSIHVLMEEEMTVEVIDDPINRRVLGRVVENYAVEHATELATVLFTNCV